MKPHKAVTIAIASAGVMTFTIFRTGLVSSPNIEFSGIIQDYTNPGGFNVEQIIKGSRDDTSQPPPDFVPPDPGPEDDDDDDTLDGIDTSGWYVDLPNKSKGSLYGTIDAGSGGVLNIYKGLPWDTNSDTYLFNLVAAHNDFYTMIEELGAPISNVSSKVVNSPVGGDIGKMFPHGTLNVFGENCWGLGVHPSLIDREYVSGGHFWNTNYVPGDGIGQNGKYQLAVVIVKKGADTSNVANWYSIPATRMDYKAHTWPWGVAQTNIRFNDKEQKLDVATNSSGSSFVTISLDGSNDIKKTCSYLIDWMSGKTTIDGKSYPGAPKVLLGLWHSNWLETENCDKAFIKKFSEDWDVVGVVKY